MSSLATARQMQAIHNSRKIISFESLVQKKNVESKVAIKSESPSKSCEVYAFKSADEIKAMIEVLDRHIEEAEGEAQRQIAYRNKMLFIVGINVGIRASDLRELTWRFFFNDDRSKRTGYRIKPQKTRKLNKYVSMHFNKAVETIIDNYIAEYPIENLDDYLFASQKGNNNPITVHSLCRIIKETAQEAGIDQNVGSHSLRKTFGYWVWHTAEDKNNALIVLQYIFNHSSPAVTTRYIGLMDDDVSDAFNSLNLGLDFI